MKYIDIEAASKLFCPLSMASSQITECRTTECLAWQKQTLTKVEIFGKGSRFEYPIIKFAGYS